MPHEKSGILPSREWKRRVYKQAWFPGETVNTGIGQGYLTLTPMQLAQATAMLAMRGTGFKPHMVHAVEVASSRSIAAVTPEPLPPVEARDHSVFDRVIEAMQLVTQAPGGTAYAVFKDAPYTVAGKTGTAQVAGLRQDELVAKKLDQVAVHLRDHALFMAFAPVNDPQIAIAVIAEHAGHGGSAAAPVARQVIDQYLLGKVVYNQPVLPPAPADAGGEPDEDVPDAVPPDAGPGAQETPLIPVPPR